MRRGTKAGFTLVEVIVALTVLGIGIIALAGSLAIVTRAIGRGRMATHAAATAARRMDALRASAYATSPWCTGAGFAGGGPVTFDGVTESWQVTSAPGGLRDVAIAVSYPTAYGLHRGVLRTRLDC